MQTNANTQLVDAKTLREVVWHQNCKPSLRWIRTQQKLGRIPSHKVGGKVFFNPTEVQAAIQEGR